MKPSINSLLLVGAGALALGLGSGCATDAQYTDPTNSKTQVTTLGAINVHDWDTAADQMIQSLLTSPALANVPKQPAVMAVDRIVNKTDDANLDTESLTKKIRVALNKSGKVLTTTTYGRNAESGMAADVLAKQDFMSGDRPVDRSPDFTLTGKIIKNQARAGGTTQVTFVFQLSLTDTRSGLAVWEEEKSIQKTADRNVLGW